MSRSVTIVLVQTLFQVTNLVNLSVNDLAQAILRREELLLDPEQRYARIIILYYMAMEHRPLYACLKLLYTQAGLVPMRSALCRLIRQLYTHPRTLKQMCRVTIYNAVGRCSALSINKLPLPGPLKEYILNFDP